MRLLASVLLLASLFSGCASPPSPAVRPFGDNQHWIVTENLVYRVGNSKDHIVVPQGFVTDYASIPKGLWSLGLSPHGRYSRAAVIHDFLYWAQPCSRAQSDRLMLIAMKESKVGFFDETVVYHGVDFGGKSSWDQNSSERTAGLPRVVPHEHMRPKDPNVTWPEYRAWLVGKGVKDPQFPKSPAYCVHGNSTQVPSYVAK